MSYNYSTLRTASKKGSSEVTKVLDGDLKTQICWLGFSSLLDRIKTKKVSVLILAGRLDFVYRTNSKSVYVLNRDCGTNNVIKVSKTAGAVDNSDHLYHGYLNNGQFYAEAESFPAQNVETTLSTLYQPQPASGLADQQENNNQSLPTTTLQGKSFGNCAFEYSVYGVCNKLLQGGWTFFGIIFRESVGLVWGSIIPFDLSEILSEFWVCNGINPTIKTQDVNQKPMEYNRQSLSEADEKSILGKRLRAEDIEPIKKQRLEGTASTTCFPTQDDPNSFNNIYQEIHPARNAWYNIGIMLNADHKVLAAIRDRNHGHNEICLQETLEHLTDTTNLTLDKAIDALGSELVNHKPLAEKLRKKYPKQ